MRTVLEKVRWIFHGVRLIFPLMLHALWYAGNKMVRSIIDYWRESQTVVNDIANHYIDEAYENGISTNYDEYIFWVCFSIASFLFLVGWYINAWLTLSAVNWLLRLIF